MCVQLRPFLEILRQSRTATAEYHSHAHTHARTQTHMKKILNRRWADGLLCSDVRRHACYLLFLFVHFIIIDVCVRLCVTRTDEMHWKSNLKF